MGLNFDGVRKEMQRQVDEGIRPSVQIAIDWRGEVVFDEAVGDGATPDSNYVLWSIIKPFVAITLLQCIDDGKAGLGDKVSKYIPEFASNGKEGCTIAHLLSHRGGFPGVPDTLKLFQNAQDWDKCIAITCGIKAEWKPGTACGYHPISAWYIVAELAQRLRGESLWEMLRKRVLDPAGIDEDGLSLGNPEVLSSLPLPVHGPEAAGTPLGAPYWNEESTHALTIPGGSGISRSNQVIKLYRALLNRGEGPGGRILSPEMIRTATHPHAVGSMDRTFNRDIAWGLGFHMKHVVPSLDDCGITATPGTFGHSGHFIINTSWADPGKDLVACVLANGLTQLEAGFKAVTRLSQSIHDVIDKSA